MKLYKIKNHGNLKEATLDRLANLNASCNIPVIEVSRRDCEKLELGDILTVQ